MKKLLATALLLALAGIATADPVQINPVWCMEANGWIDREA